MPRVPESPGVSVLESGRLQYASMDPTPIDTSFDDRQKEVIKATVRMNTVQQKMRREAIETRASDVANQYYRAVIQRMTGKDGALTKKKADVVQGYNGKSFVEGYMSDFHKLGRDLISTLPDQEIAEAVIRKMSNFDNGFVAMLSSHEGSETRQYQIGVSEDKIAIFQEQTAAGSDPWAAFTEIKKERTRIADINGIDINSKEGKARVLRESQAAMAQPIAKAIEHYVLNNDFNRATDYLRRAAAAGIIDGDTNTKLADAINKQWTAYRKDQYAERGAAEMVKMWEPSYRIEQSAPEASRGWMSEFESDSGARGALALEETFGGAYGALAASCFSTREALGDAWDKAVAKYGDKVTAENLLEFNEQAKNQYTRVKNRYDTMSATYREPNLQDAYAWAQRYAKDETPEVRAQIAEGILSQWKMKRAERDMESAATIQNAIINIDSGNPINRSDYDINYLSGTQRAAYDRLILKGQRDELDAPGNARLLEDLWNNPNRLINMSETDFLLLRADLSRSDWAMLADRRAALNGKPPKGIGTDLVSSAIDMAAANLGITTQLRENKEIRAMYESVFYEELSKLNMQRGPSQGKIPLDEAVQFVQSKMGQVVSGTRRSPVHMYQIEAKDIPEPIKRWIRVTYGKQEGELSDQAMLGYFHRAYINPFTPDVPLAIPQVTRARIEKMYVEKTGRKPDADTVKQIFFNMEMGNQARVNAATGTVPTPAPGTYSATYPADNEIGDL